jgi:hypothetical protein
MPVQHEVRCVKRSDHGTPHGEITHIGGLNDDYTRWQVTLEEAIAGVENGKWAFYVARGGLTVDVIVATTTFGAKYLTTTTDGGQPDTLVTLVECPRV